LVWLFPNCHLADYLLRVAPSAFSDIIRLARVFGKSGLASMPIFAVPYGALTVIGVNALAVVYFLSAPSFFKALKAFKGTFAPLFYRRKSGNSNIPFLGRYSVARDCFL